MENKNVRIFVNYFNGKAQVVREPDLVLYLLEYSDVYRKSAPFSRPTNTLSNTVLNMILLSNPSSQNLLPSGMRDVAARASNFDWILEDLSDNKFFLAINSLAQEGKYYVNIVPPHSWSNKYSIGVSKTTANLWEVQPFNPSVPNVYLISSYYNDGFSNRKFYLKFAPHYSDSSKSVLTVSETIDEKSYWGFI